MKKRVVMFIVLMMFVIASCKARDNSDEVSYPEWNRTGFYRDDNGNELNISRSDDQDGLGWLVELMIVTEETYSGRMIQDGNILNGDVVSVSGDKYVITVSEDNEDGILLKTDKGDSYQFWKADMVDDVIRISIKVEGPGYFTAMTEGDSLSVDEDSTSVIMTMYEPETYVLTAKPDFGSRFVKWTRDGADYSTEEQMTVEFSESGDYAAIFERESE